MKRLTGTIVVMIFAVTLAFAQAGSAGSTEEKAEKNNEEVTLSGVIIDKHCVEGHEAELESLATSHAKACALKCAVAGKPLGLISEGKWYSFDQAGSKKAAKLLKKSKSDKAVRAEVTGSLDGEMLTVSSIKEASSES